MHNNFTTTTQLFQWLKTCIYLKIPIILLSITPAFKDIVRIEYLRGSFEIKAPIDKVLDAYLDAEKNGIGHIVDADY